ncbi:TPR repeat region-containing protein [Nocardiopsis dassonvillei]|uniref:TPR repeat region-containing protein n=1 Tax=Nocardiopsis dassonvillei TaxID=2014 RepID=UPI003671F184
MSGNTSVLHNVVTTTAVTVSSTNGLYSTKSFCLWLNSDPDVKPLVLASLVDDLNTYESRILGRAHDLEGDFDDTAKEFTEIIKWDISSLSAEDLATWMEVSSSIRFCSAITQEWADYMKEYKEERLRIINKWNEEAPGLAEGLDEEPPFISPVWSKSPAEKAEEALAELKSRLEEEEAAAYRTFESRAEEIGQDLRDGPTPEAIERLMHGGYVSWSYFNLGGDVEALPIDLDPEEAAQEFEEYVNDPENYDGDISGLIALINNISIAAMDRQGNGGTLTGEELDFLRDFYASLEESGGPDSLPPGVLNFVESISTNQDIDTGTAEELLGALGNGLLVISDESLIGGYDNLPESIRSTVEGPAADADAISPHWYSNALNLSLMMGHTIPGIQGGEQFSVNLAQTVGYVLDGTGPNNPPSLGSTYFENLVEVASRNEDAMHALLTGEGQYEHPEHGLDAEMTLRGIYTYDWGDEGESAGRLTDWIAQESHGDYAERERAGEAMASLMRLFGDPAFSDALAGTGYSVAGEVVGPDGSIIQTEWGDASAGHVNPQLAGAWSELFSAYIEEFGSGYGTPSADGGIPEDQRESGWNPGDGLQLTPADRENFVRLIMGDEDAASRVYAETLAFEQDKLYEFLADRDHIDDRAPESAGTLRGLVDSALQEEAEIRTKKSSEEDVNYRNKVTGYAADMVGAALAEAPYPGSGLVAEVVKIGIKEGFDASSYPAELQVEAWEGEWEIEETFKIAAMRELAQQDPEILERLRDLEGTNASPVVGDEGDLHIPPNASDWDLQGEESRTAIRQAWREIESDLWGDTGYDLAYAMGEYTGAYNTERGRMDENYDAVASED